MVFPLLVLPFGHQGNKPAVDASVAKTIQSRLLQEVQKPQFPDYSDNYYKTVTKPQKDAIDAANKASQDAADALVAQSVAQMTPAISTPSYGADTGDVWYQLRVCESTNNYSNKNNSNYRGAYQFSYDTWASVGGSGDPADASPTEQDMRAQMLQQRLGWGQWGCAYKIGII